MNIFRWMLLITVMLTLGAVQATSQDEDTDVVSVQIEQILSKASMNVRSCTGASDMTTVTVTLSSEQTVTPVDIALVVDRSSSEDLGLIQDAAYRFLAHLNPNIGDRVSLVSFADTAQVDQPLTSDFNALEAVIDGLDTGELTALGDAMSLALDEVNNSKNAGSISGIVVLSDGGPTTGLDPLAQADRASALGLPIYFVGVSDKVNRSALSELARRADGNFFASANTQSLIGVLKRFERELMAEFITINETLPDVFSYAGGPDGVDLPLVTLNANNATTALAWDIDALLSGQVWSTQFNVTAEQLGTFPLNRSSILTYLNASGVREEQTLPNPNLGVTGTAPPISSFQMNPDLPKANQTIEFFDRSTAGGTINSWAWDFGDGTTSTEQNPTHVYENIGRFTVSLTVTDSSSCAVTFTRTFRISEVVPGSNPAPPPQTNTGTGTGTGTGQTDGQTGTGTTTPGEPGIMLSTESVNTGEVVNFSISSNTLVASCSWTFGDGASSTDCDATHTYTESGTFTLTVVLTFQDGSTRTLSQQVIVNLVNQAPVAGFIITPFNPRVGQTVGFDSSLSSDADGTIASWSWDFGDDTTSTQANPLHEYGRPGRFTVSLTVTDDEGATHTLTQPIPVGLPRDALGGFQAANTGPEIPEWMEFYIDGGVVTDEELEDAARRFANGSFVQSTQYRLTENDLRSITDIHDLRVFTAKYIRPEDAEADGYARVGAFAPGIGQRYVNEELLNAQDPPQFDRVPVLLYAPDGDGLMRLAGVSFVALDQDNAELFGFDSTDWMSVTPTRPQGGPTAPPPGAPGGVPNTVYLLVVWIWSENPEGMFVPLNPAIE